MYSNNLHIYSFCVSIRFHSNFSRPEPEPEPFDSLYGEAGFACTSKRCAFARIFHFLHKPQTKLAMHHIVRCPEAFSRNVHLFPIPQYPVDPFLCDAWESSDAKSRLLRTCRCVFLSFFMIIFAVRWQFAVMRFSFPAFCFCDVFYIVFRKKCL